jgi:hypothetical protein
MEPMNGMNVTKILRIKKMMGRIRIMRTIAAEEEMEITSEDYKRNISIPKGMVNKPPENALNIEADPAVAAACMVKTNIIASTIRKKQKKKKRKKYLAHKFSLLYLKKKGSKKYTTYIGLIDSSVSGLLINKELVEYADFKI